MLEAMHCSLPTFSTPCTVTEHHRTSPAQVLERIRDATIAISIMTPITSAVAAQCPSLQLIVVMATGTSWVEHSALADLGITVINCPQSNIAAVSEHALGLYFAVRKRIPQLHHLTTTTDRWADEGTLTPCWGGVPPRSCAEEVVGIVGYGALGARIEALMRSVGMAEVIVAERKGATTRAGRVPFEEVLRRASVLVLCCPKDASTVDLIGETEMRDLMPQHCVLINVARGGVVNEAALARALREAWIGGAATDVMEAEPGRRGECPLMPPEGKAAVPNLVISPHVAWYASRTLITLRQLAKQGIESYVAGSPINIVVDPGSGS